MVGREGRRLKGDTSGGKWGHFLDNEGKTERERVERERERLEKEIEIGK